MPVSMRVLACTVPEAQGRLRAVLPDAEIRFAFKMDDALRALAEETFDLLIVGMLFDESRALEFVEHLQGDAALKSPPFVGIRGAKTAVAISPHLFDLPMRALGAADVIDFGVVAKDEQGNRHIRERLERCLRRP